MDSEVRERLLSNHKLGDPDRDVVLKIAGKTLASFQKKP
jgi:hypothetical protein